MMPICKIIAWRPLRLTFLFLLLIQACATYPPHRPHHPFPRTTSPSGTERSKSGGDAKVEDRSLQEDGLRSPKADPPEESSLIAKIDPATPPYRAASLRFTEEGKRLLESGEYAKALARLEKTVAMDAANPYAYYYLAKTHYQLGHYRDSLNFLDVAESLLAREPYWLAEVHALRGENLYALGFFERASSSYSEALRWDSANRTASQGFDRLRGKAPSSPRLKR